MKKLTLINKDKTRIKVFKPLDDVSKSSLIFDAMEISYGFVYRKFLKKVLSGESAFMACLLAVALFNTFNAGTIIDHRPPPSFLVVLILNPILCIYGLVNNKKLKCLLHSPLIVSY